MSRPNTTARRTIAAEKRRRAMAMKLAGATHMQIADRLGISDGMVSKYIKHELKRLADDTADATARLRQLELSRLDALQDKLWPRAMGLVDADDDGGGLPPDPNFVDRVLRIVELRCRLLGIEKPQKHELSTTGPIMRAVFHFPDNGRDDPA